MPWQTNVFSLLIIPTGGSGTGLFVYNGAPGAGNPPVDFDVAPGVTKDPFGNNLTTNANANAVFGAGTVGAGQTIIDSLGRATFDNGVAVSAVPSLAPDVRASLLLTGGKFAAGDAQAQLECFAKGDGGQAVPQFVMSRAGGALSAATTALLEVQDPVTISSAAAAGKVLRVTNTTASPSAPNVDLTAQAAGDSVLGILVAGDANRRVRVDSDTSLRTGPGGATALDTLMQRLGPAVWGPAAANGIGLTGGAAPAAIAGVPLLYGSTGNRARQLSPAGHDTILSGTRTDTTATTVTQAAFTALTALYTVQGTELAAGSVLEVDTEGIITWGSTQQTLLYGADVDSALFGNSSTILATAFAAGASLNWEGKVRLRVQTAGAGGTASVMVAVTVSPTTGSRTVGDAVRLVRRTASVAFNTTVSHTIGLGCQWGSTTGAPTITSDGSTYRRDGS